TPGRGTCFTITLPLGTAHLPTDRVVRDIADHPRGLGRARAYVEEALRWLPAEPAMAGEGAVFPAIGEPLPRGEARGTGERILLADD
ncbi:hypothetical protein ABTI12_20350, partial [Acinetobacter baumannii]